MAASPTSDVRFLSLSWTFISCPDMNSMALLAEEDLSDLQIQELLEAAEGRMRSRPSTNHLNGNITRLPRLGSGKVTEPYVKSDCEVARVDSQRLLDEKERKLSSQPRKIEDPLVTKKKQIEVGLALIRTSFLPMRKIYPTIPLTQTRAPFWMPPVSLRVPYT